MQYAALLPEEVVQLQRSRHWGVLAVPVLSFIGLVLLNDVLGRLLVSLASLVGLDANDIPLLGIKVGVFLPALAYLVHASIGYLRSRITVTSRRIMMDTWFIGPQSSEVFLSQVGSVSVVETLIGRYLGYGSVVVQAAGGKGLNLSNLADPGEVHAAILRLVMEVQSDRQLPSDEPLAA